MSLTVDCGEGKHDLCRGRGRHHFLIPQLDDGEEFECDCLCHQEDFEDSAVGDSVIETAEITNGDVTVRIRIRQSGTVVVEARGSAAKHKTWVCSQLYLTHGLRVVLEAK